MTAGQLTTYDVAREALCEWFGWKEEKLHTQFIASSIAGFIACAVTSPFDVVKSRCGSFLSTKLPINWLSSRKHKRTPLHLQFALLLLFFLCVSRLRMMHDKSQYRSLGHAVRVTLSHHGVAGFYRGFVPYFVRLGPQTVLQIMAYERIFLLLRWLAPGDEQSKR